MYGFTIKIKMLILAKVLSLPFLKESVFTKYLFIYVLQQTKAFNVIVKHKLEIEGVWKNTKRVLTSMTLNFGLATIYQSIYKIALLDFP